MHCSGTHYLSWIQYYIYTTLLYYTIILHYYTTLLYYTIILHYYTTLLYYTIILHYYTTLLHYTIILHYYTANNPILNRTAICFISFLHIKTTRTIVVSAHNTLELILLIITKISVDVPYASFKHSSKLLIRNNSIPDRIS